MRLAGVDLEAADPVRAGDAPAAAFLHGLAAGWPASDIARFANRPSEAVAATPGAIPEPGRR